MLRRPPRYRKAWPSPFCGFECPHCRRHWPCRLLRKHDVNGCARKRRAARAGPCTWCIPVPIPRPLASPRCIRSRQIFGCSVQRRRLTRTGPLVWTRRFLIHRPAFCLIDVNLRPHQYTRSSFNFYTDPPAFELQLQHRRSCISGQDSRPMHVLPSLLETSVCSTRDDTQIQDTVHARAEPTRHEQKSSKLFMMSFERTRFKSYGTVLGR